MKRMTLKKRAIYFAPIVAIACASSAGIAVGAANTVDLLNTGPALDTAANWNLSSVPGSTNDAVIGTAYPLSTTGATTTLTLDTSRTFGSFNDTNNNSGGWYTYIENNSTSNTASATLTLGGGGTNSYAPSTSDLLYENGTAPLSIFGGGVSYGILAVALAQTGNFEVDNTVNIFSVVSGSFQITKTGSGTLYLGNANNTFGGANVSGSAVTPVTISAGTLDVVSGASLGSAPFSGSTTPDLIFSASSTLGLGIAGASEPFGATRIIQINSGAIATFDTGSNTSSAFNVGGGITGAGSLNKIGAGTLQLDGTSTFTGGLTITAGTVSLNTNGMIAGTSPTLNMAGGTFSVLSGHAANETFTTTTLQPASSVFQAANFSTASVTVSLGAIVRNPGSVVDFTTLPTTGALTTTTANANFSGGQPSILGGYATALGETTWAVSGNNSSAGTISALATYDTTFAVAGADVDVTASISSGVPSVNSLRFNTGTAATVTIPTSLAVATGGILSTTNAGSNANLISGGTLTSGNGQELTVIQNNTGGFLIIGSAIVDAASGSIGLTKAGAGTLQLTGTNTFSGPTYVTAGTLNLDSQFALQDSTLSLGTVAFAGNIGAFSIGGVGTTSNIALIDTNSSAIALTIGGNNASTTFSGIFTGAGSLTKIGTGDTYLSNGNSTFTGGFTIQSGVIHFISGGSFGGSTNVVTIDSGAAIAYNGTGASTFGTGRGFTLEPGSETIQIGSTTTANNTSSSSLTIGASAGTGGILAGAGAALIKTGLGSLIINTSSTFTGGVTVSGGTLTANSAGGLGTTTIAGYTGAGPLAIVPTQLFATVDLTSTTSAVSSLTNYIAGAPAAGAASLVLGYPAVGGATAFSVGADNTSTTYSGSISDLSATYSGAAGSLTKTGTGTLTLSGTNTYTGGTNVSSGVLALGSSASLPVGTPAVISTGAAIQLVAHTGGSSGIIVAQPGTLTLQGTTGSWTGAVDITNNDLVIQTGSLSDVISQVVQGMSTLSTGIYSSSVAGNTSHLTTIGVILNNTGSGSPLYGSGTTAGLFDGSNPALNAVLVKYTYYGDANLDGAVDGSDYTRIDAGFASGGTLTGWYNGDFNYDGKVDGSDYTLIDNAFNTQGATLGSNPAALLASSTAQFGSAAVPEPASVALLAVTGAGLLSRRRRR